MPRFGGSDTGDGKKSKEQELAALELITNALLNDMKAQKQHEDAPPKIYQIIIYETSV